MTLFDYAALVIVGLSLLLGLLRGAVKEVLSLLGWIAAFLLSNAFAPHLADALVKVITNPGLRMVIAYAGLFVVTLIIVALLKMVLSELINAIGLGGVDKVLGMLLGIVRGALIVMVIVLACGMTTLPQEPFWRASISAKWFETAAIAAKPWLPNELVKRINFHSSLKA